MQDRALSIFPGSAFLFDETSAQSRRQNRKARLLFTHHSEIVKSQIGQE
jgi:hypothetical protein